MDVCACVRVCASPRQGTLHSGFAPPDLVDPGRVDDGQGRFFFSSLPLISSSLELSLSCFIYVLEDFISYYNYIRYNATTNVDLRLFFPSLRCVFFEPGGSPLVW
jgi:hypothetical protein